MPYYSRGPCLGVMLACTAIAEASKNSQAVSSAPFSHASLREPNYGPKNNCWVAPGYLAYNQSLGRLRRVELKSPNSDVSGFDSITTDRILCLSAVVLSRVTGQILPTLRNRSL